MGRVFFPLDQILKLRGDRWSEGAARVAVRMGLSAPSFVQAARDYTDATGGRMSGSSLWRITQATGEKLAAHRETEATAGCPLGAAPGQVDERPDAQRVAPHRPLSATANLSTDGGMIHVREEGWKEVKISTLSAVSSRLDGKRDKEVVHLSQHSYIAWLGSADEFAPYQYAEGLRRGLDQVEQLSSVNDGAPWIGRITELNFPEAIQILDWYHAKGRLCDVAQVVQSDSERREAWLDRQLSHLRKGKVSKVIASLQRVASPSAADTVRTAPEFFRENAHRMRYDQFRNANFPIGSGTVESAVQRVIQHRMHRPGRGWARQHASGMIFLLCDYHSNRFHDTWRQLSA